MMAIRQVTTLVGPLLAGLLFALAGAGLTLAGAALLAWLLTPMRTLTDADAARTDDGAAKPVA